MIDQPRKKSLQIIPKACKFVNRGSRSSVPPLTSYSPSIRHAKKVNRFRILPTILTVYKSVRSTDDLDICVNRELRTGDRIKFVLLGQV